MKILHVVGARPNFMKVAPVMAAFSRRAQRLPITQRLVHTGQHYDRRMSELFFEELGLPRPDINLDVGSASHGAQTGRIMEKFEAILLDERPDLVMVVGDVNSTLACAVDAKKMGIPVAHVEAGLRSFDRSMPEEINRLVTDAVSDLLLVSEPAGVENLRREGHAPTEIHLTGNVMIDTLRWLLPQAQSRDTLERLHLQPGQYGVVTLHRPSNVDDPKALAGLLEVLAETAGELPMVFPIHPRTQQRIERFGLAERLQTKGIVQLPPVGYLDFLALTSQARVIVTDSGGLQEESTALGIPCLTTRPNTERPITVEEGTSTLVGSDMEKLRRLLRTVLQGTYKQGRCPALWDGHAAQRIASVLAGGSAPS